MLQLIRALILVVFLLPASLLNGYGQLPVKNYEKEWKNVEAFVKKGLPKSALEEVKRIYTLAKKDNQDAQLLKALVYSMSLQAENRVDNEIFSVAEMEKEISGSKEPVSSILKNLLAGMYWNYYQRHRWQLYNRTPTDQYSKTDMTTWGVEDFHRKISALYLQSIREEKLLQQTKLETFDAIITKGNMRHLRPSLYDLLAHQALAYFQNDERDLKKPAYAFQIDQAAAFDPAADFINRKFPNRDSLSLQYKALLVYQKLIAFHLNDPKPDALIDADLLRIGFVHEKSTHPDKDGLYFNAINHIAHQYETLPAAAQAWYLLAVYHNEKAGTYKPFEDTTHRFDRLRARAICEKVLQQKDSSEGKMGCYNLLKEINEHSLQFDVEKINIPGQAFRVFVKYRNFPTLYLRIIPADEKLKEQVLSPYDEKYWPALIGARPLKSWQQSLPETNDLQEHAVEIKADGLPPGEYMLLGADQKDLNNKNTRIGARLFYVSSISYVNNDNDFFVLNRDNGQPLANAAVQVWEQEYDYKQSKYVRQKTKAYHTDANGFFRMEKPGKDNPNYYNYSYLLDVTHNGDRLFMSDLANDYYYYNTNTEEAKAVVSVFLFTDRSIYRPGQTVFFKGIVLGRNSGEKNADVKAGYKATLFLRDVNFKTVDTLVITTNEYGSFNGKFQLPASGLNGQFTLYAKPDGGFVSFRVEEYKRPRFYVNYEPIKGTYKVNDKINVTGIAKAYAGNNIDGATVAYRIVRQPRFIYPWLFWRWWQPPSAEMEIAQGEMKTDRDGKFTVEFTAIPDLTIDKKLEPVFDYRVYADVTDINGETRSGEKTVSVSYKSLMLLTTVPGILPADSLKTISILTQNMNGEHEPAKVNVRITRLKEEKRLIRTRYWSRPDQFVMPKEEYIKNFPYDEYDNESDYKSWEKGEMVFDRTDSSTTGGEWGMAGVPGRAVNVAFKPGFYIVEITTRDKNGEEVKDVKYTELYNEKSSQLNKPVYLWTGALNTAIEPGETAKIELGTGADNLFVVQSIDRSASSQAWPHDSRATQTYSYLRLSNEKKVLSFDASEADRGGYGTGWIFVKHNRFYQLSQTINVPWTNKELSIEYTSFRDKTLPGSEEKWKLKISGYKTEKVAAEMLASMYDASLDQFYAHSWKSPYLWPYYYNRRSWSGSRNFIQVESDERYLYDTDRKVIDKRYDQLYGENLNNEVIAFNDGRSDKQIMMRGMARGDEPKMAFDATVNKQAPVTALSGKVPGLNISTEQKDGNNHNDSVASEKNNQPGPGVVARKNFNETAFFFPELRTDSSGAVEFSFTLPEALTRWKFMALAHTKDAAFGGSTKEIVTQKELMVQPNAPRFLREGDKIEFSSKLVNLSDKELKGKAGLQLFDAATNLPVDALFNNNISSQGFTVLPGQSLAIKFPIDVPFHFNKALTWKIVADAGNYSDGEENILPVLSNRMLVTETMPITLKGTGTKDFNFEKLAASQGNGSLQHYALTVEYTSNPAWYAVQALPYLMEYPYECAEQTWNRYYANSLAGFIVHSSPRIKQVFEQWKIKDTAALMSNLQKNQDLKAVLLEETPWVLEAKNESEQKRNIALLFDMIKMGEQLNSAYDKLKQMQSSNGGFVWFSGGPDDRYITQYIVTGIGHLKKLNAVTAGQDNKLRAILSTAIPYLDRKIKEDYDDLLKYKTNLRNYTPGYTVIQYLYMRSFFADYPVAKASQTAYDYFRGRVQQTWVGQSKYMQAMIALALFRTQDTKTPVAILRSLKETAITNEELGMYWKDQRAGWFWYEAPIETQSLLIEAFREAGKDQQSVEDLKTWLLKNKQANNWKTTKATAEACYALLLQGKEWVSSGPAIKISLGSTVIRSADNTKEAGTGYFRNTIEGNKIKPDMGKISVTVESPGAASQDNPGSISWGAVYWQYFEDLDKITTASTPLKLSKKLFVEKNSDRGPVLTPVNDGDKLNVGDKIKVRIELRVDRDMEYVHMKDMRASAFEPVNVLSGYKWQGGLGYYESTKDASTNFFFNYLAKGTYVFEYPLFVTHAGDFSNGITTIQCMYAPEFSSHSEGVRVIVRP